MPAYHIDLSYDGTRFHGYARQENARTVQGVFEAALARVLVSDHRPATSVAGRTDSGTHARQQVAGLSWPDPIDLDRLTRALNRMLAPEVVITGAKQVADDFDARRSAIWRRYRYRILQGPQADPFRARFAWYVAKPLDLAAMREALKPLVGPHDYASFCRDKQGKGTSREIYSADWSGQADELILDITARAFCHQMVRSIVAVCVEAGKGRLGAADVEHILETRDRRSAKGVAPAHGLTLWEVGY